jgi:putative FmdB family regulatory protein
MPIFDFLCNECGNQFDSIEKQNVIMLDCPKCKGKAERIFPTKPARFDLKYNPKKDKCDWDGNSSQYYRLYNEAKDRGEKVSLPE